MISFTFCWPHNVIKMAAENLTKCCRTSSNRILLGDKNIAAVRKIVSICVWRKESNAMKIAVYKKYNVPYLFERPSCDLF